MLLPLLCTAAFWPKEIQSSSADNGSTLHIRSAGRMIRMPQYTIQDPGSVRNCLAAPEHANIFVGEDRLRAPDPARLIAPRRVQILHQQQVDRHRRANV